MPSPSAETAMLIRKPMAEVFEAFVNPDMITKYWFTKSTGRPEAGKTVTWEWEMYGASAEVYVKEVDAPNRLVFEWPAQVGKSTVEVTFQPHELGTFVAVKDGPFDGDAGAQVKAALDSTGGFTIVLCAMKVFLEHGIEPGFVVDRFPKGL